MRPAAISRARGRGAGLARATRLVAVALLVIWQVLASPLAAAVAMETRIEICATQHSGHQDRTGAPTEDCLRCADCIAALNAPPKLAVAATVAERPFGRDGQAQRPRARPAPAPGPAQFWSSERAPPWQGVDGPARVAGPGAAPPPPADRAHTPRSRPWV